MNIIYSASGVLTVFYMGLLLSKSRKGLAEYILSIFFFLVLLVIITTYLNHNQIQVWIGIFELTDASVFLLGPIMWFYTQALTNKDFRFQPQDLWHFIPFAIGTCFLLLPVMQGETIGAGGRDLILLSKMLVLLAYVLAVLWRLRFHEDQIGDYYSYTEKVNLNWLKLLAWGFFVIWVIGAVSQSLYFWGTDIPQYGGLITNLALSVFVLVIGYFGIRQTDVFSSSALHFEEEGKANAVNPSHPSQAPLAEPGPDANPRFERLQEFMESHKPYRDGELTLYRLAEQMQLPPNQLSQLINQHGGSNFFNFVNQYRVRDFQQRIQEKAHVKQTLLSIALDCGFNSKASFNRVFKNLTGKTPRQYAKEAELW